MFQCRVMQYSLQQSTQLVRSRASSSQIVVRAPSPWKQCRPRRSEVKQGIARQTLLGSGEVLAEQVVLPVVAGGRLASQRRVQLARRCGWWRGEVNSDESSRGGPLGRWLSPGSSLVARAVGCGGGRSRRYGQAESRLAAAETKETDEVPRREWWCGVADSSSQ